MYIGNNVTKTLLNLGNYFKEFPETVIFNKTR